MPKDLKAPAMTDILLPDLLSLTKPAVAPAEAVLEKALAALREKVSEEGRVSARSRYIRARRMALPGWRPMSRRCARCRTGPSG